MIRLLLVGCGNVATAAHLPALADLQGEGAVEVTVHDLDPSRARAAAERFGMRAADDWRAAADGVDAVSVCLPPGINARVAAEVATMGRHVLCEKPPGRTVEQAREMALAARPDQVTMIAFNRRFNPLYEEAMARFGTLGPPTAFYGRVSAIPMGEPPSDGVDDWITSAGSHALDLAVATMGYPNAVSVDRKQAGDGPDKAWSVLLHCPRGSAVLLLHFASGRRAERFELLGPGYDVRLDLPKDGDMAVVGKVRPLSRGGEFHTVSGFTGEYRAFLAAVAGGPRPACDFAYGVDFMRLVATILSAPPAVATPVEREPAEAATSAPDAAATAAPTPTRAPQGRPVVVLHQPPGVHPRFFAGRPLAALHARCDVRVMTGDDPSEALRPANAIVTGRGAKPLPNHLGEAPDLGLVVVVGASVRGIDADKLVPRGVIVCNTADAVAQSVAEHCLMFALAGLRRLPAMDREMHAGQWPRPGARRISLANRLDPRRIARQLPLPPAVRSRLGALERRLLGKDSGGGSQSAEAAPSMASDLRGQVVGLLGWGHTARRFTELLAPFECTVLVASDAADRRQLEAVGARPSSLGEIVATARIVSLHRGLTDATRGFLDGPLLDRLRPGTVLVNTARGPLIDEAALVRRLGRGDIVAALDVYDEEPLPRRHPLRKLPNVILTPHNASTTEQEERRMGDEALSIVLDWLDGKPVPGLGPDYLARMT